LSSPLPPELGQDIILPPALNNRPAGSIKPGPPIKHIRPKVSLNTLPSGEHHPALAMLAILRELPLVLDPVVPHEVKVMEGELLPQRLRLLVVELAVTVELLGDPLAGVGGAVLAVEERALAVYLVIGEVAFVVGAVAVQQLAVAAFFAV